MTMKTMNRFLSFALLLMGVVALPAVAATLTLNPVSGIISGNPGQTIGWGYTITNSTNFLSVTGSEFDLIPNTQTSVGTYVDFIGSRGVVVGPAPESPSVTSSFNNASMSGTGRFTIFGGAAPGSMNIGQILIHYDLFSRSPNDINFNRSTDTISTGNALTASAQVNVTGTIPEPASFGLAGAALLLLAGLVLRRG